LRLLKIPHTEEVRSVYTSDELPALIDESRRYRLLDQDEHDRMIAALALRARTADSVMVPMADVVALPATTTAAQLQDQAGRHGHSRFPVYGEHPARLRGYLHVLDALNGHAPDTPLPARSLPRVSARASLDEVLATMRNTRAQLAAVTDPEDSVIGVVTLEDVLAGVLRRPSAQATGSH
jgi:CBS domain containing-hemolysin-like protein